MRHRIPSATVTSTALLAVFLATPLAAQKSTSPSSFASFSSVILQPSQRDSLVALAQSQVGARYRWGAILPGKAFDCSGLVKWVMAQMGIPMPRASWLQATRGVPIPKDLDQLLPGDLLYFSSSSRVDHIGIYVGNGKFVHAANRKKGVILADVPTGTGADSWWKGVRRVFTSLDEMVPLDLAIVPFDEAQGS